MPNAFDTQSPAEVARAEVLPATVTVRFAPGPQPQAELCQILLEALRTLRDKGVIEASRVEAVFPDDGNVLWRGAFVVHFDGNTDKLIEGLRQVSGVKSAYLAAHRETMRQRGFQGTRALLALAQGLIEAEARAFAKGPE